MSKPPTLADTRALAFKLAPSTREELLALEYLHRMTRKILVAALRELQLQPTHLAERTRDDVLYHVAFHLSPSGVWREVRRQQGEA